jgi:beta-lactamase regulating signal transducer with metallopeptidase domain
MIVSFMLYSIVLGAFVAAIAWLLERALGSFGRARRNIWIVAIVAVFVLPPLATVLQAPVTPAPARLEAAPAVLFVGRASASLKAAPALRAARIADWPLDTIAAVAWISGAMFVLAFYFANALRLSRRARAWRASNLDTCAISVAPDIGPALYGWWRPRIVFPAWLLAAPAALQRLALAHEREHLAVRDPQILAAATLLAALLPWNAALWWMLRRLRFSMEVDCDARVLRGGADPSDYGLALLFVSERQARSPIATIALIERRSQLERRINIMVDSPRHRVFVAGLCIALAGTCALAATQIEAPARIKTPLLKPAPTGGPGMRVGQSIERLLQAQYPELIAGNFEGTPVIVALFNDDFSIAKATTKILAQPAREVSVEASIFETLGIAAADVPYHGETWIQLPQKTDKLILAAYTERPAKPGERFVSRLFPDTRVVDRQLFERYFDMPSQRGVPAGDSPWVLLDREGKVLRSGLESVDTTNFREVLGKRFGGIRAQEITVTPVVDGNAIPLHDVAGKELNLVSVWLSPDSPLPKD